MFEMDVRLCTPQVGDIAGYKRQGRQKALGLQQHQVLASISQLLRALMSTCSLSRLRRGSAPWSRAHVTSGSCLSLPIPSPLGRSISNSS